MAYTDLFNVAIDTLGASIAAAGLRVTANPQDVNPPCAVIEAPNFTAFNYNIAELDFPVRVVGLGPANLATLRSVLANCATLLNANIAVTSGTPVSYEVGGQQFAAYDLTVKMKVQSS